MLHRNSMILVIVATGAVLLLGLCAAPIVKRSEWISTCRQIESAIVPLQPTNPDAIDPKQWKCAHGVLLTAFCNLSTDNTSNTEMHRLRDDIERELNEKEVTPDTLRWIWLRIGRTGPFGKQYIERFPFMHDCFPRDGANLGVKPAAKR